MITEGTSELRKTGISVIGDVRWGTHFCYFYKTKEDLLETQVLYFKAGLENKELCLWVVSQVLSVEEAKHALGQAVPDLERHLAQGALEIHNHDEWYLRDGQWDPRRVLQSWREKLHQALGQSYAGLRAAGDGGWIQNDDRMVFCEYEEQVNAMVADQRIIILCTYPLTTSPGDQVFDIAHIHEAALARRNGSWEVIETNELKGAKAEIKRLNEELEQKVEERTRELAAANEALKRQILERKELEQQARALIDAIPQQIWSGSPDGTLEYCNARWRSYMGIGLKDLQGDGWQTMLHPNDRDRVLKAWHESVTNGTPYTQEERHLGADGTYRWFLARAVPRRDGEGRIVGWYGTNTDIEDRKRTEEALRKSEKLFAAFMKHMPGFAWIKDIEGRYVYVNKKELELEVYRDGVIGKTDAELWPAEIASAYRANDHQVITTKKAVQVVEPSLMDGEQSHMLVTKFPIFDQEGSVVMVAGAGVDITDLIQAEEALNAQVLRYKTLMETSTDSIYVLNEKGDLQQANAAFLRQRGYTAEEVKGLNVADWDARWTREQLQARLRKLAGSDAVFETRHRCKDGSIFDVEVSVTSVRIGGEQLFFCVTRDITERKQAEEKLRESEARFRELAENIDEIFWIWTATPGNPRLLYVSPAYATIWGRSCESLYGSPQSWKEALHPDDKERVLAEIAGLDPKKMSDLTYRIVRPDQSIRWIRDRIFPVRDLSGEVVRFAGVAEDITESKEIAKALEGAEEQYHSIFNNAANGIFRTSPDGKLLVANPAAARIFGFASPEESIEARWDIARQGYVDPRRREELKRLLQEQGVVNGFEFEAYRKDGSRVWISENTRAVHSQSGELLYFEGFFEDVTDRKRAEEALWHSLNLLRAITEGTTDAIYAKDREGRYLMINTAGARFVGKSPEEVNGLDDTQLFSAEAAARIMERDRSILDSGETRTDEDTTATPSGVFRVYLTTKGPLRDSSGAITGLFGVSRDITERRQEEEKLRESEARFRRLLASNIIGVIFWTREGDIFEANDLFLSMVGYTREDLHRGNLNWKNLTPPEYADLDEKAMEELVTTGTCAGFEKEYIRKDGSQVSVLIGAALLDAQKQTGSSFVMDISERKQAEDRLRRSEEKFKTLFGIAPVGISVLDRQLNVLDSNPALEQITRLSKEELLNGAWRRRTYLNADGTPKPLRELPSERAMAENTRINDVETGIVTENGEIIWTQVSVAPLDLPDASAVVITRDITERKRAAEELEEANRQLRILSRQLFHIQEEERRHLARELHDEIGQTLTAAKINLKIIAPDVPAKVSGRLADSVQLLDRLLRQVRQLSLDLRPPLLDELGLVPTLRWLVDQQAQRAGLRVTFTADVNGLALDPDVQTACFRVAQEAITNIIRHSGAKSVAVKLRREAERLTLSIRDDGAGFDPAAVQQRITQHSSLGLVSMKERALLVRGGLEIHSAPRHRTEIRAWFPLPFGQPPSNTETA